MNKLRYTNSINLHFAVFPEALWLSFSGWLAFFRLVIHSTKNHFPCARSRFPNIIHGICNVNLFLKCERWSKNRFSFLFFFCVFLRIAVTIFSCKRYLKKISTIQNINIYLDETIFVRLVGNWLRTRGPVDFKEWKYWNWILIWNTDKAKIRFCFYQTTTSTVQANENEIASWTDEQSSEITFGLYTAKLQ